ncbi:hypothetical protein MTO96_042278 [Rhipicephalus appendiculatus]
MLMERFRFYNRSRREGESLGQFIAALRGLASACAFEDQLNSLVRDIFVCGINYPAMQTCLLEFRNPSGGRRSERSAADGHGNLRTPARLHVRCQRKRWSIRW